MLPQPFTRKELLAAEREPVGATVWRGKPAIALRYALAPACVGVAALLHLSPAGPLLHPMGLFILGVVAAAWFGGAGPGVFAAFLSAIVLPHLIAVTYPLSLDYPLLAGFFDLPRFVTFGLTGAAVGWGTSSYRRAQAALRERERLLTKARDELETAVAERTAHLSASAGGAARFRGKRGDRLALCAGARVRRRRGDCCISRQRAHSSTQRYLTSSGSLPRPRAAAAGPASCRFPIRDAPSAACVRHRVPIGGLSAAREQRRSAAFPRASG